MNVKDRKTNYQQLIKCQWINFNLRKTWCRCVSKRRQIMANISRCSTGIFDLRRPILFTNQNL